MARRTLAAGPAGDRRYAGHAYGYLPGARVKRRGPPYAGDVEIVLKTETPDGIRVVLPALVYAKVLEEHAAVADLELIDRTIRSPDERRPDPRSGRERFLRRERGLLVLAVVEFGDVPAIIVTVFSASSSERR
jgi:hypothetical protein